MLPAVAIASGLAFAGLSGVTRRRGEPAHHPDGAWRRADNLALWQSWHGNLLQRLGPDHPGTLATRGNVAYWTGEAGDARGALELFTALLPDRQRVLGPDHPATLSTRHNVAYWTGQAGDARGALDLTTALLPGTTEIRAKPAMG